MSNAVDLERLLGDTLVIRKDGVVRNTDHSHLRGKYVCLYFSAHWCPPCRAFTPKLRKTYLNLIATGKPVEVVFISSDSSPSEFEEYFNEMPWCAVPYENKAARSACGRQFGIAGIPSLVILSPEGRILNANARTACLKDPTGERFPWEGESDASGQPSWRILLLVFLLVLAFNQFFGKK